MGYVAAGALAIGVATGWTVKDWQCEAAYSKALEKADKQRQEMQGQIDEVSTLYQSERDKADGVVAGEKQTIREIYKTLPAVPVDCAPDVRIVRVLESSVNRANAAASGELSK
jgi:signal transduction protein with GAF and PtsI domain